MKYLTLVRPKQWVKNGFVFSALIFSGNLIETQKLGATLTAFAFFCVTASAAYVFNDLVDAPNDRLHPTKARTRPIASGEVTEKAAKLLLLVLWGLALTSLLIQPTLAFFLFSYAGLNIVYSKFLKHIAIVDIFCIALGFVLRVAAGAAAIGVPVSTWMFSTTFSLALFLAATKRKTEINLGVNLEARKALKGYTSTLAGKIADFAAVTALIFYSIFAIQLKPELAPTLPLVMFGIFRYWLITEEGDDGEAPSEALYRDRWLLATVVVWALYCVIIYSVER